MAGKSEHQHEDVLCLLSSFSEREKKTYGNSIKALPGGVHINSSFYVPDCNVIICKVPSRGEKYLCGCIAEKPVLTPSYITNSVNAGRWLKKSSYEWCNQSGGNNNNEEKLLKSLPRRCKAYAHSNNGKHVFQDWKVLLHIPDKVKRSAYKRLLEAGGAKILNLNPPFHVQLKYVINYAFATKESVKDLSLLHQSQFHNILYPDYISEYLVNIQLDDVIIMKKFKHFERVPAARKTTNKSPNQPTITQMFQKKRRSDESSPSKKRFCHNSGNASVNIDSPGASMLVTPVGESCNGTNVCTSSRIIRDDGLICSCTLSTPIVSITPVTPHIDIIEAETVESTTPTVNRSGISDISTPLNHLNITDNTPFFSPSCIHIDSAIPVKLTSSITPINDKSKSCVLPDVEMISLVTPVNNSVKSSTDNTPVLIAVSSNASTVNRTATLSNISNPANHLTINDNSPFVSPCGINLDDPVTVRPTSCLISDMSKSSIPADVEIITLVTPINNKLQLCTDNSPILIADSPLKRYIPSCQDSCIEVLSDEEIPSPAPTENYGSNDNFTDCCIILDSPVKILSNDKLKTGATGTVDIDDNEFLDNESVIRQRESCDYSTNCLPVQPNEKHNDEEKGTPTDNHEQLSTSNIKSSNGILLVNPRSNIAPHDSLSNTCNVDHDNISAQGNANSKMLHHNSLKEDILSFKASSQILSDVSKRNLSNNISNESKIEDQSVYYSVRLDYSTSPIIFDKDEQENSLVGLSDIVNNILKDCNDIDKGANEQHNENLDKPGSSNMQSSGSKKLSGNVIKKKSIIITNKVDVNDVSRKGGRVKKQKDFSDYVTQHLSGNLKESVSDLNSTEWKEGLEFSTKPVVGKVVNGTYILEENICPKLPNIIFSDTKQEISDMEQDNSLSALKAFGKINVFEKPVTKEKSEKKKKMQSVIKFAKSPNKYDSIIQNFDEKYKIKMEEGLSERTCTSKSRFGRQRKPKRFSSDFVTPSTSKRNVKRDLEFIEKLDVDEGVISSCNTNTNFSESSQTFNISRKIDNINIISKTGNDIIFSKSDHIDNISLKGDDTNNISSCDHIDRVPMECDNTEKKFFESDLTNMISSRNDHIGIVPLEIHHNDISFVKGNSNSLEIENNCAMFAQLYNDIAISVNSQNSYKTEAGKGIKKDLGNGCLSISDVTFQQPLSKPEIKYSAVQSLSSPVEAITSASEICAVKSVTNNSDSDSLKTRESTSKKRSSKLLQVVIEKSAIAKCNKACDSQLLDNNKVQLDSLEILCEKGDDDRIPKIETPMENFLTYLPSLRLVPYCRKEFKDSKVVKRASFAKHVENMVEANMDQGNNRDALKTIKENTSSFYYPKAKTIALLFNNLINEKSILKGAEVCCYLNNLVMWHPVKEIMEVYFLALQKPIEDDDECVNGTVSPMEFIMEIITDISDTLKVHSDERLKTYKCQLLLLKYIVSLLYGNFQDFLSTERLNNTKCALEKLRKTLIWKVMWGPSQDPSVNKNLKELINLTLSVVAESECEEEYELSQMLITMISLSARCCSIKDKINSGISYSTYSKHFVCELQLKCDQILFEGGNALSSSSWFFNYLHPHWLCYRLLEFLLLRYSDELVDVNKKHILRKSLSLEKIVYCYFFLHPKLGGSYKKVARNTPLKDIKNIVNTTTPTSESKKTPKRNLNRRNIRGETPLQVACIKNNSPKVKELLSLGADPNSKDNAGWSPLHEACNYGFVECAEELLKCKELNILITNSEGISVLHDAVQNNHMKIVEKLVAKGGKKLLELKTMSNRTAYDLAATKEMKDLLSKSGENETEVEHESELAAETKIKLNIKPYENIAVINKESVEEYLYLLMTLLRFYTSVEGNRINVNILKTQFKLLEQHLNLIANMSVPAKLYLKSISKLLLLS